MIAACTGHVQHQNAAELPIGARGIMKWERIAVACVLAGGIAFLIVGTAKKHDISNAEQSTETHTAGGSQSAIPAHSCVLGTPVSGRVFVGAKVAPMMKGPGRNTGRVVNELASDALGRREYRELDPDYDLESVCDLPEWIMVKIVGADGLPEDWETGWIEKRFLVSARILTDDQKRGLYWNIDAVSEVAARDKQWVKKGALKALADDKKCVRISDGFRDIKRPGYYFVTCRGETLADGYNVFFRKEDVNSNIPFKAPDARKEQEAFDELISRQICETAIRGQVKHPSTLNIKNFTGYSTLVYPNKNRIVWQEFSAKNEFGLELTYTARCLVEPDGNLEIVITEKQ